MNEAHENKASFGYSALTISLCVAVLLLVTLVFKAKLQLGFLIAMVVALIMGVLQGHRYSDLETAAFDFARKAMPPVMVLAAVGAMIAMWIACGTVPTMIYYGLQLIIPSLFLVIALILCSVASVFTGTSWGTMGSVGIAMMGVGAGLGISAELTAAAVICGAMFGDKMSPLSDTTNLCPAVVGCEVMTHVKHMLYTTVPAYLITVVLFLILGLRSSGGEIDLAATNELITAIQSNFSIGLIQILPAVLVLTLLLLQKPAFLSIMYGTLAGLIVALLVEGNTVSKLLGYMWSGYTLDSGVKLADSLFSRGGVFSMAGTILTMLFSCCFAGILHRCGMIEALVSPLVKLCKSNGTLMIMTAVVCYGTSLSGSMTLSQVLSGTIMKPAFDERELAPENLSRCLEDFSTFSGPLIPWHNTGIFIASTLLVGPGYIPFCFLLYLTPLFDILYGFTGFSIKKIQKPKEDSIAAGQ